MDGPAESSHWVQSFTRPASQPSQDGGEPRFAPHPNFPRVPASVPLTYTLTMVACLSERPEDRPTFTQAMDVLTDVVAEVRRGSYINSDGVTLVRATAPPPAPGLVSHLTPSPISAARQSHLS